jgi:hypothetical protein
MVVSGFNILFVVPGWPPLDERSNGGNLGCLLGWWRLVNRKRVEFWPAALWLVAAVKEISSLQIFLLPGNFNVFLEGRFSVSPLKVLDGRHVSLLNR